MPDSETFGRRVERLHRSIYAYALSRLRDRSHAEDVAQEVFLRAWKKGPEVPEAAWLFATARNVIRERFRDRAKFAKGIAREEDVSRPATDERREKLMDAFEELPDEMRMVLTMKYAESLTCAEIAKRLGRPLGTITSLLSRAYHEIRDRIKP